MAGKNKESKLKSMLERGGLIKKRGDGANDSLNDTITRYNPDIKPIIDMPDDSVMVKTAPKQPVPGMASPIFPEEQAVEENTAQVVPAPPETEVRQYAAEPPGQNPFAEEPTPPEPRVFAPPPMPQRPPPPPDYLSPFRNESVGDPAERSTTESAYTPQRPQSENYTERFLNVNELYEALALKPRKTDSVYLIEEYLKTLPDSLPNSSRREIVNKIISASGFDYDLLMGDGVLRVKMLKEYAERFARHTDDYVAARQAEIEAMDQQIQRARRLIDNRKDLHKRQFFTIEAEAQRLKDILTFISG